MNREQLLREMGLAPSWRLRSPPVPLMSNVVSHADWFFVGEGPSVEENETLLDNMLASIGLKRGENVCVTTADNTADNIADNPAASRSSLEHQIELLQPKLIVALGQFATQLLLQAELSSSSARGQLHHYKDIPVIVTYHPADLLRKPLDKARAWEDLCFMRTTMRTTAADS